MHLDYWEPQEVLGFSSGEIWMEIESADYKQYLESASFTLIGDYCERLYGDFLSSHFPNCEKLWRAVVVPLTKRVEEYPLRITSDINFREGVDTRLMDLASIHYSLFLNLIYAHLHLEKKIICSVEDIFIHLGSACDLVETFLENWYLLRLLLDNEKSDVLQNLSEEQFLELAKSWYRDNYADAFDHYLSKGKMPRMQLPSRHDILKEYLANFPKERKTYIKCAQDIREFRNVIVHDVKVGRIVRKDGNVMLPVPKKIREYRRWANITRVINSPATINNDFQEAGSIAKEQIGFLESAINHLWQIVLKEFDDIFFAANQSKLRNLYAISFITKEDRETVLYEPPYVEIITSQFLDSGSGVYYGGTADYWASVTKL